MSNLFLGIMPVLRRTSLQQLNHRARLANFSTSTNSLEIKKVGQKNLLTGELVGTIDLDVSARYLALN